MGTFVQSNHKSKGAPSYDDMRSISRPLVEIAESLKKVGLPWSAICVLRGVTRVMCRFAGGYESVGRKRPGAAGHSLTAALRTVESRLECTLFLRLYDAFDRDRQAGELLVSPNALLEAWLNFDATNPGHTLTVQHGWLLARELLQNVITLVNCKCCGVVHMNSPALARCDKDFVMLEGGCYICGRRRTIRNWLVAQKLQKERAKEATRNRSRRRVTPGWLDGNGFGGQAANAR